LSKSDGSSKPATSESDQVVNIAEIYVSAEVGGQVLVHPRNQTAVATTALSYDQSNEETHHETIWETAPSTAMPQDDILSFERDSIPKAYATKVYTLAAPKSSQPVVCAVDIRDFAKLQAPVHESSSAKQYLDQRDSRQAKLLSKSQPSPARPMSKSTSKQTSANQIRNTSIEGQAPTYLEDLHRMPRQIFAKAQAVSTDGSSGDETTINEPTVVEAFGQVATALLAGSPQKLSRNSSHPKIDLAIAAERHMLYRRKIHRTLELIERGYWSFDISGWAPDLQLAFLQDLRTHVESRMFGEGSWVDLHFDKHRLVVAGDLYCGIAELGEAWLLLMVLSDRRLGESDMHWYGWDGQAALTMPGKPMRSVAATVA
jgi:hypothetical protein